MQKIDFLKREQLGKAAKRVSKDGMLPAVLYDSKRNSYSVSVDRKIIDTLLKTATSTTIIDSTYDGKNLKVILKEVDKNPVTDKIRHLSFFIIDESHEMVFTIPFNIIGISPAVKNNLGILVKALDAIDVKCKLADLVSQIDIDISNLEHPGQSILVSDVKLPAGVTLPNEDSLHTAIVTITQLQKEEEVKPVEELVEGEALEGEEGKAEGEEGKEEEKKEE